MAAAALHTLPSDLLLLLATPLDITSLRSLTLTCHRLHTLLAPFLHTTALSQPCNLPRALTAAAKTGSTTLAALSLSHGADASAPDSQGHTPLHHAAHAGHTGIIRLLLDHNAKPRTKNNDGVTPLYLSVQYGHHDAIELLLVSQYGALVTGAGRDENGASILHWAALQQPVILQRLVHAARMYKDVAFDINVLDTHGETPLHWAARAGNYRTIRALVTAGARADIVSKAAKTPLHAVFDGTPDEKTLEALLRGGAHINAEGPGRETALHMSVRREGCAASIVIYLVEASAAVSARNETGQTPLHIAAETGKELVAWYLIDRGADVDAMDYGQRTPLHTAIGTGRGFWRNPVVNLLLEKGASVVIEDAGGQTVLELVREESSGCEEWERVKIGEVWPGEVYKCTGVQPETAVREYREPEAFSMANTPTTERPPPWKVFERESKKEVRSGLETVKKLFKASRASRYRMSRSS